MTAKATTMATATTIEEVIDQYIAAWNETDPGMRRALIDRTWTEDGSYLDPLMNGEGHDGIDAMIAGVQTQFPGYRFRRTGELDAHHDRVRYWAAAAAGINGVAMREPPTEMCAGECRQTASAVAALESVSTGTGTHRWMGVLSAAAGAVSRTGFMIPRSRH